MMLMNLKSWSLLHLLLSSDLTFKLNWIFGLIWFTNNPSKITKWKRPATNRRKETSYEVGQCLVYCGGSWCLLIWLCHFLMLSYTVCPPFCAWSHPWREPLCTSTWNTHRHLSIYCHWFQGISTGMCQGFIYLRNKRYDVHIWESLKLGIHRSSKMKLISVDVIRIVLASDICRIFT